MRMFQEKRPFTYSYQGTSHNSLDTAYTAFDDSPDGGTAKVVVQHPSDEYIYPEDHTFDDTGQGHLFDAYHSPAQINSLHSSPKAAHLVTALLAHAHKVHNGDITYSNNLSSYSSPVVLRALQQGWVKENPYYTKENLEHDAAGEAKVRRFYREHSLNTNHYDKLESDSVKREAIRLGEEMPESDVAAAQEHFKDLSGVSRFKPKSSVSDSQLTLPGMP